MIHISQEVEHLPQDLTTLQRRTISAARHIKAKHVHLPLVTLACFWWSWKLARKRLHHRTRQSTTTKCT